MEACGPIGYNPPNFVEICKAYKVKVIELAQNSKTEEVLDYFLKYKDGPIVLDVNCHEHHTYEPRIFGWNTPIEDMYPYIPREEFKANMKIKPVSGWENPILPDSNKKNSPSTME
jgi:acetolactate synthase-1/2/3 large subunit